MSERVFEYTEGTSQKFWSISLDGKSHTVRFGRLGSSGQTQTKEFATEAEARKSYDKLIQEKLKKGYVERGTGAGGQGSGVSRHAQRAPAEGRGQKAEGSQEDSAVPSPQPPTPQHLNTPTPSPPTPEADERRIALEPEDWFWATWRDLPPLPRPEPPPFEQKEALERLARIATSNYGWDWDWTAAGISPSMTREEAQFWLAAMTRASGEGKPKALAKALKDESFSGEMKLEQVEAVLKRSKRMITPEIIVPLANLFPADALVERMLAYEPGSRRTHGQLDWQTVFLVGGFTNGFRKYIFPYLSGSHREALRALVRQKLDLSRWPTDYYETPHASFHLAAALGLHEEVRALVEGWADDQYVGETHFDFYHMPQEVVFGLGDPRLMEAEMRRLKLVLKKRDHVRAWLAHTEYGALDYVRDSILANTNKEEAQALLEVLALVRAPEAAAPMLELMLSSKAPRGARAWLEAHPAHAAAGLLRAAAGQGRLAEAAMEFLRGLKRKGYETLIRAEVEAAPSEVAGRIRAAVLDYQSKEYEPLDGDTTPGWLKSALAGTKAYEGGWVQPSDLPSITIGEQCLNPEQTAALMSALQKSTLEKPHPLVTAVKAHADPAALDVFAWRLFELWLSDGAPPKEKWAMIAVGLLGSDVSALKLTPLVRAWPGESQHQRAVLGLEVLRAIGTDTALMQIHGIAQRVPFKGLKAKAAECMEAIAKERGFTRAELEDRIVPDCDLDERGTRTFDFGPRQFQFVLGPGLKPMVRGEDGKLKPNLPAPGVKDDAGLAGEAVVEWKLLKKQVGEVVKIQAFRLEQVMVTGRRWRVEEFEGLLVRHPLMVNLVRLLVWGAYDAQGKLTGTFRVTEDQSYADATDETVELAGAASVGIVHPLHLEEGERAAWGELFSDYELVPPFTQLGRALYDLEPGEGEAKEITRFKDIPLPPQTLVFTLEKLGWARGVPQDAGIFYEHSKPFYGANVTAVVQYDGVPVGYYEGWDDQKMERCFFVPGIYTPEMYPEHKQALPLGEVDPVVISEVLNDLTSIAAKGK
jgi:predicted DNA-binding WGR domain protein